MVFALNSRNLIFLCILKMCLFDLKSTKAEVATNFEEILRRHKIIQSYLSELAYVEKDWIETYHLSLHGSENVPHKTVKQKKSSEKHPHTFEDITPFQNLNSPDLENIEQGIGSTLYNLPENKNRNSLSGLKNPKYLADTPVDLEKSKRIISTNELHIVKYEKSVSKDKISENIDVINKKTVKNNEFCVSKINFYLTKTCDVMKNSQFINELSNKKLSNSKLEKRKARMFNNELKLNSEEIITEHKIKDFSLESSSSIKESFPRNLQNDELSLWKENVHDSNLHHRQNLIKSYLSELHKVQEDWIETYHNSYIQHDSEEKGRSTSEVFDIAYFNSESQFTNSVVEKSKQSFPNHAKTAEDKSKLTYTQEKLYFIRWVNKLFSKYTDNFPNHYTRISFSFSSDSLNVLKEFSSKSFDLNVIDELICDLISNATVHNEYNLSSFFYVTYMPIAINFLLIMGVIFLAYNTLYSFRFSKCFTFVFFSFIVIAWNGFKLYQKKLAEKHATMSGINSSYCESILTRESGIIAHIKEYFRHSWHNEDCKKYYAALMIDPLSEISFTVIVTDLISSSFFHAFELFGYSFNIFFKDLTYGLGIIEHFYIFIALAIILFFSVLLISVHKNYKIKLPFFMGSIEPSVRPYAGSQVEDVQLNKEKHVSQNTINAPGLPQLTVTNVFNLTDLYGKKVKSSEKTLPQLLHHKNYFVPKVPMVARRSSF